jgi:cell division protein FtsB
MPSPTPQPLRRRSKAAAQPPPRWRGRFLSLALGFVAIVLVVDALVGNRGLLETMRARRQYAQVAADLARKRRENEQLREDIRRLSEDPSAIESVAREQLGLMRDGEVLFVVHDAKTDKR